MHDVDWLKPTGLAERVQEPPALVDNHKFADVPVDAHADVVAVTGTFADRFPAASNASTESA